jgi:hypothetical protein
MSFNDDPDEWFSNDEINFAAAAYRESGEVDETTLQVDNDH